MYSCSVLLINFNKQFVVYSTTYSIPSPFVVATVWKITEDGLAESQKNTRRKKTSSNGKAESP
jgi:hypothetical protein